MCTWARDGKAGWAGKEKCKSLKEGSVLLLVDESKVLYSEENRAKGRKGNGENNSSSKSPETDNSHLCPRSGRAVPPTQTRYTLLSPKGLVNKS